jgi:endo-1,4-beta-mannosidase
MDNQFLLGVNYWPCNKAMSWWKQFDAQEVEDEFEQIRDLGLKVVRFFMLWEDFQPKPFQMNQAALRAMQQLFDIAEKLDLKLQPTFFTGHMSGYNWAPEWVLTPEPDANTDRTLPLLSAGQRSKNKMRSMYRDPVMLRAMLFNIRTIVPAFRSHPALFGWDLGNEPDIFQFPPDRDAQWLWHTVLLGEIKRLDTKHPAVCGMHLWSLTMNSLRPDDFAEIGDMAIMHAYSIYCDAAKEPLDSDVVPFASALTQHFAHKPVLFQEFGTCTAPPGVPSHTERVELPHRKWDQFIASEEDAARYFGDVLEKLWQVGALGAFPWCYGDYSESLWDRLPCDLLTHERTFGLVRSDHSLKPHAKVVADFAAEKRPVNPNPQRFEFDGIKADQYWSSPDANFKRLFAHFSVDVPNSVHR